MGKGRLEAFSDGVLAIILTIMVLELRPPAAPTWEALRPLVPKICAYLLSFLYVAIYWSNHHHMVHTIRRVTGPVLWANTHLLFWLSLVPISTHWTNMFPLQPVPTAVYGFSLFMPGVAYWILQTTIIASQGENSVLRQAIGHDFKGIGSVVSYGIAIGIAFVAPMLSYAIFIGVALLWLIPDRRIERQIS